MTPYADALWPLMFQALLTIVLVFGSIGFATGVGLIVSRAGMLRFFGVMNRWISIRSALKPAEMMRDVDRSVRRHRCWIGVPLVVGGLASMLAMATIPASFSLAALATSGGTVPLLATVADALRLFLIAGGALGAVVGLMLCLWPEALRRIEMRANRWISPRLLLRGADEMHPLLDDAVEAHPARSGWLFAVTGLAVSVCAAALLLSQP